MSENSNIKFDPDALQQLGRIDLIARFIVQGFQSGVNKSLKKGVSTEFSDFKSYAEGDDIRFIDWRLFARTEKLFIKTFEAEKELQVMLVLDASKSMAWEWEDEITKLQYAVNLIASMAVLHIKLNNKAGLLLSVAGNDFFLKPRSNRRQLDEIFAMLGTIDPGSGNTLERNAILASEHCRQKSQIIICTDFEEDPDATLTALDTFSSSQSEVIVFHILHKAEETLPFDNATHLQDSETGEKIKVDSRELKKFQENAVSEFRNNWKNECENRNCTYIPVSTKDSYVEVLMELLEMRKNS